jgi:hypothetical protein
MLHFVFQIIITLIVLYGCEVWGPSISRNKWNQIEGVQKHLIKNCLRVKTTTSYEMPLTKIRLYTIKLKALRTLILYRKKMESMENDLIILS